MKIDKQRLKAIVEMVPKWLPTIVCSLLILWLTLAPHPVGDLDIPLFPGADKLVHALMFFGLTLCILFDTLHVKHCKSLSLPLVSLIVFIGMAAGTGIEILQASMGMGRSFEFIDIIADIFGAVVAGGLWAILDNTYFRL